MQQIHICWFDPVTSATAGLPGEQLEREREAGRTNELRETTTRLEKQKKMLAYIKQTDKENAIKNA